MDSADTGTTGIVFIVGNSLVGDAKFENKRGALTIKNSAAYRTVGEDDLVYVQTITDGTGDFACSTGSLRVHGTFLAATGGTASFEGTVCVTLAVCPGTSRIDFRRPLQARFVTPKPPHSDRTPTVVFLISSSHSECLDVLVMEDDTDTAHLLRALRATGSIVRPALVMARILQTILDWSTQKRRKQKKRVLNNTVVESLLPQVQKVGQGPTRLNRHLTHRGLTYTDAEEKSGVNYAAVARSVR